MARRFNEGDLRHLKRGDLVTLVEGQINKWPTSSKGKFKRHKTNMEDMKWALINCEFTTSLPLPSPTLVPGVTQTHVAIPPPPIESNVAATASITAGQVSQFSDPENRHGEVQGSPLEHGSTAAENVNIELQDLPLEQRSILLLVEDTRRLLNERISQRIEVSVSNRDNCETGQWRASAAEVVSALQGSISAFQGPARIGTADEEAREFTKFFGTIVDRDYHDAPELDSHLLLIPSNDRLNLIIARRKILCCCKVQVPFSGPCSRAFGVGQEFRQAPDFICGNIGQEKREPLTDDEQAWLTKKANEMEGFNAFQKHHNQRLTNSDRVKYWKFASNFCKANYKKYWPVGIERSGSGPTIRKDSLEVILGMKRTALDQAINMGRILEMYYDDDSSHQSAEVVSRIEGGEEAESAGSEALAKFLMQWEKDHPI
ncbi:hypothetical protein B0H13DRAFT_1858289 [Mycena leptocephala]|nr:hypothetical protein B0H13DRAFT_1858289 [Mycena leptocephala]